MSKLKATRGLLVTAALSLALVASGCAGTATAEPATGGDAVANPEIAQLVEAAKAEGPVTLYAVIDERMVQKVQEAFTKKYGVKLSYMRATAAEIAQRFSAEAEAGAPVADVILNLDDGFIGDSLAKGTLTPLEDAKIPGYPNALAAGAVTDGAAVVQLAQLAIAYNTDHVQGVKGWQDLLRPELKGKVVIGTPDNGIYNALFYSLSKEYGQDYLQDLGGQVGRVYSSGSQIIEALGSGEAYAVAGTLAAAIDIAQQKGAPVEAVVPGPTLMAPTVLAINSKAPHSAGARLLAYYLTTEEGLKALNDGPGLVAPTSDDVLKSGWIYGPALNAEAAKHSAEVRKDLGIR